MINPEYGIIIVCSAILSATAVMILFQVILGITQSTQKNQDLSDATVAVASVASSVLTVLALYAFDMLK